MFDQSKYRIDQMSYPSDIMDPKYAGNMVVFYINVANASKFQPTEGDYYDMSELDTPINRGLALGRNVSDINMVASSMSKSLVGIIGGLKYGVPKTTLAYAGADAIGLEAAKSLTGTTTREMKRLKTAIALHMPNRLAIRYSADWQAEDTVGAEIMSKMLEDSGSLLKALNDTRTSQMTEKEKENISSAIKNDITAMAAYGGLSGPGGSYASVRTGLTPNPRKEMVFKGVDFRSFSFDYSFFPRDENEAQHVMDIIHAFKFHMHPEYKDASSFLYLYPSEFDIQYFTNLGENRFIHRHSSCVLTELNVDYTPNGNFNTFLNGMPTQINITMSFKELAPPTKESVYMGI